MVVLFPDMQLQWIARGIVRHVNDLHGKDRSPEGAHHERSQQGGGILIWHFHPVYEFHNKPSWFAAQG